jgi:lysyl-tRNA synthetase class 2
MAMVEDFVRGGLEAVNGSLRVTVEGHELDFGPEFPRLDFAEAFKQYMQLDIDELDTIEKLAAAAKSKGMSVAPEWGRGKLLDEMYKEHIRPQLIQPTFIINHPVDLSPLAKKIADRPNYTERMQLVVAGKLEMCNGFSELNDPLDQLERFKNQEEILKSGDEEAMMADYEFVEMLEHGMPPTCGYGFGERLFAIFANKPLRELQTFPLMRPNTEK